MSWTALLLMLCLSVPPAVPSPYVEMHCATPVVLDAPMAFTATLHQPDTEHTGPFVFKWSDNASPAHWREQKVDGQSAVLNLTYPAGMYEAGKYRMEVSVYVIMAGIYRERIAEEKLDFEVRLCKFH